MASASKNREKKEMMPLRFSARMNKLLRELSNRADQSIGVVAEEGLWESIPGMLQKYQARDEVFNKVVGKKKL